MKLYYAALDSEGNVMGVEQTSEEATQLARELVPGKTVAVQTLEEPRQNPIAAERMPAVAMRLCGIPPVAYSDVLAMSEIEAWDLLHPYFEGLLKRGIETRAYDEPRGMADAWIGQNYKTKKAVELAHDGAQTRVMGVTLVPAFHPRLAALGEGPYAHLRARHEVDAENMLKRWAKEYPFRTTERGITLCAGSSENCRDSCLVFTGQNASELYNTYRKVAQTMALLNQPVAFCRMLVSALDRWLASREVVSGHYRPYVRLNVLSDIPWESVCPWLFQHYAQLSFYDYTKVPGRVVAKNYDLTFSISGEDANFEWAQSEITKRGRRIAVVFLGHKRKGTSWREVRQKGPKLLAGVPLPRTFWGLRVVDGDVSDVRPRDPAPSCVGLRWKTPSGKRSGVTYELEQYSFVVPVYVVSEDLPSKYRQFIDPRGRHVGQTEGWEGEEPNPSREQWLIAPVTPRYQPIEHTISQPIG